MEIFKQVKDGGRYSSLLVLMTRIMQDVSWEGDSCLGLLIKSLPSMVPREGYSTPCG